ncbi:MAG: hypothetical protein DHS20C12_28390 [Pseudohongiella sp.]|nr:MAG: hypothetical protein DHS20C01_38480 [marine bacterium B5-7]GJM14436.1 MAG: hypothetical protein DHS20C12_28390 [Pseudohongiella sp.]
MHRTQNNSFTDPKAELEWFKRQINLCDYATSFGYVRQAAHSTGVSVTMVHPQGDKVVIARRAKEHWIYFSVREDSDHGTVIDFHQRRTGANLGQTRRALRLWLGVPRGGCSEKVAMVITSKAISGTSTEGWSRAKMLACYRQSVATTSHRYLQARGISVSTMSLAMFAGRIRSDRRANALFPHRDETGICGFELKNDRFTGYSRGGKRGLWTTRNVIEQQQLVICESAIDALSYMQLTGCQAVGLASMAGAWGQRTGRLLKALLSKSAIAEVVLAFDNDDAGEWYATHAQATLRESGRRVRRLLPADGHKDWNDCLRATISDT